VRSVLVIVILAGCGVADFDIDQAVPEQRVVGSPLPGPLAALFKIPLDLDLAAEIEQRETGPIDSITLSSLELDITATDRGASDSDDWAFVEEIRVFVKSSASGSSLPRVEIAHVAAPGAVQKLEFAVESVDIKPYVDEGSVVESEGRGTVPADDVSYDGKAVFTVHPL
jgi:hypothetical protein